MELHRNRNDQKLSLVGIGYGILAPLVGTGLVLLLGGPLVAFAAVFLWVTGVFFLLLGLLFLVLSLRPFRIRLDEAGLHVRADGQVFEGPWSDVEAISIEATPPAGDPPMSRDVLVLWVADGVRMRHRPTFPPAGPGPKGHVLVELENLRLSREEVASILIRYAGPKFRTLVQA
ncbi:hypothetical protein [Micromonospora sp. CPCC 206061]|uniref:hypothetical protein n=1 Tax=Micromonospora sp. CPCC 206061 TaxID=3122410 RepID=UPI002FF40613